MQIVIGAGTVRGCLYCIGELADCDADKLKLIDEAIASGEVHVLAVRTSQEFLLREVRRGNRGEKQMARENTRPLRPENAQNISGCLTGTISNAVTAPGRVAMHARYFSGCRKARTKRPLDRRGQDRYSAGPVVQEAEGKEMSQP